MSETTTVRASVIATWTLMLIVVCLRFFARRVSKAGLWYDDWLVLPATVSILYTVDHGKYLHNEE